MATRFRFEFPPEVQREREVLLEQIRSLTAENTLDSIRAAQRKQAAWLDQHPDDYVVWDMGEVLAKTEDSLLAAEQKPVTTL